MLVGDWELLGDADLEPRVRGAQLTSFLASEADRLRVRIDPDDLRRVRRATECHTAITAADVYDTLPPDQAEAAVFSELILGGWPQQ